MRGAARTPERRERAEQEDGEQSMLGGGHHRRSQVTERAGESIQGAWRGQRRQDTRDAGGEGGDSVVIEGDRGGGGMRVEEGDRRRAKEGHG